MVRRVFTLEAVNELVPMLTETVGLQRKRRGEIEELLTELGDKLGDVPERIEIDPSEPEEIHAIKRRLLARIEVYKAGWRDVEATGAVLKDARTGLFDFYGEVDGKHVWLCWRYGETECSHYHAIEEGFSGRKPIGTSLRVRLLN